MSPSGGTARELVVHVGAGMVQMCHCVLRRRREGWHSQQPKARAKDPMTALAPRGSTVAAGIGLLAVLTPAAAHAAIPSKYASCSTLAGSFPHGVGRVGATDRVAGSSRPVTTWRRDTAAYNLAIHYNRALDRDHDNVACERR